jgi:hypothetical protein
MNGIRTTPRLLVSILALTVPCSAQVAHYGHHDKYLLPDRKITPGAVNPSIVADPSGKPVMVNGVEANICAKDFTTGPYQKASETTKNQVCAEYRQASCPNPDKGGIDQLIPLEIGGDDAINNLWWLPEPDYRTKRDVGNRLKSLVCSGKLTLPLAQSCMGDWVTCRSIVQMMEKCNHCSVTVTPTTTVPRE